MSESNPSIDVQETPEPADAGSVDAVAETADHTPALENGRLYDFSESSWLTNHRVDAFRVSAGEIARHTARLLSEWNADWNVTSGNVTSGRPEDLGGVDWFVIDLVERAERGLIMIDHELSLSVLVHLLGDPMNEIGDPRGLSALEGSVLDLVVRPIADIVLSQLLIASSARLSHEESAEAALGVADDDLTFFELRIDTGHRSGSVGIGMPSAALRSFAEFVDHREAGLRSRDGLGAPEVARSIGQATVPVTVRLEPFQLTTQAVSGLRPGDVVKTGHPVHRPLTTVMGGSDMHLVEAGQQGERLVVTVVAHPGASGAPS